MSSKTPAAKIKNFKKTTPPPDDDVQPLGDAPIKKALPWIALLGILTLFSYFFHIGYFPVLEFETVLGHLVSLAGVLIILMLSLSAILLLPNLILAGFIKTRPAIARRQLYVIVSQWMLSNTATFVLIAAIVLVCSYFGAPPLLALFLCVLAVPVVGLVRIAVHFKAYRRKHPWANRPAARPLRERYLRIKSQRGFAYTYASAVLMSGMMQLVVLAFVSLLISRGASETEGNHLSMLGLLAAYAVVAAIGGGILLGIALSSPQRKHWRLAVALVLVLPYAVTVIFEATGMVPMTIAHITKMGNVRATRLVLKPDACDSIAPLMEYECAAKDPDPIELCNVHVMSRLGSETYLRVSDKEADKDGKYAVRHLFIPTEHISAMDVAVDKKSLRLADIDADLALASSECRAEPQALLSDSAFDFNSFSLNASGLAQLRAFAQSLKAAPASIASITVTGHADAIGDTAHNDWLAQRRADEVKIHLDRELMNTTPKIPSTATSKGSTAPVIATCAKVGGKERIACEAPNRRVEINVTPKKAEDAAAPAAK
jgi:outer membrane protein OmpA-like peptidoglycan-associated protein